MATREAARGKEPATGAASEEEAATPRAWKRSSEEEEEEATCSGSEEEERSARRWRGWPRAKRHRRIWRSIAGSVMTKRKFYKAPAVEEDVSDPSVEIVDDDDDDDDEDYASEGSESVSARNTFRDLRSKSATITDDAIFQVIKRVTCNTIRQFVCDEGISASRKRRRKGSVNMPTPKLGASDGAGSSKTSTRFNVTYFADVIEDLDDHQKKVIGDYGFGFLLDFDRCFIPHPFARWIADHVRVKTSDIVVNNRSIPLSKESVHDVVGTPIGGKRIEKDSAGGKAAF
ncbi:hypothetical protein EJB05_57522, partial [Eragrostis curvula]